MKVLIAYASRSGTTEQCARMLAGQLSAQQVVLCNIEHDDLPPLVDFDFIALGSPVRYGKLVPAMRSLMRSARGELLAHRAGYFICCAYTDSAPEYLNRRIPSELAGRATAMACFGGEIKLRQLRGLDKLAARAILGAITDEGEEVGLVKVASLPSIDPDSISRFADKIKASFAR